MTEMISYPKSGVERFSLSRIAEEDQELLMMAFNEDDLVYINGISRALLELNELMGNVHSIEMASLHSRFSEALSEFYGEED